jgi:hypothetical protein
MASLFDRTLPSVVLALDRTLRRFGGAPSHALTDNERTVSLDQVCGIAVRNSRIVSVARHYGLTIESCVPADLQWKGGSEATVRVARRIVPTDNHLPAPPTGASPSSTPPALSSRTSSMPDSTAPPAGARRRCSPVSAPARTPLPEVPHTLCIGETRRVSWQATNSVGGAI